MALKAMNSYAQRTENLRPEGAYQVLARSQALEADGRQIIHFENGQPDVDTFENIRQAGIRAISGGQTRYTPPASLPALREAIAEAAGKQSASQCCLARHSDSTAKAISAYRMPRSRENLNLGLDRVRGALANIKSSV